MGCDTAGTVTSESCERLWSWKGPWQGSFFEARESGLLQPSHSWGGGISSWEVASWKADPRGAPRGEPSAMMLPAAGEISVPSWVSHSTPSKWGGGFLPDADWITASGHASWGKPMVRTEIVLA